MATNSTADIRKFFASIQNLITSADNMRRLGGYAIKTIQQRTRGKGLGVARPGGDARKLKTVQTEYALRRRGMKGKHPQAAGGNQSNLTLFGPLLSGLVIKRATVGDLRIGHQDIKDQKKAEGQERQGRRFMVLSGAEMRDARRFLAELVARQTR